MRRPLAEATYPAGLKSELPGIFACDEGLAGRMDAFALARDGRLLLERFFRLVPAPRSDSDAITLAWRHRATVPAAWAVSARYYRYFRVPAPSKSPVLTICGVFFEGMNPVGTACRMFARLKEAADRRLPGARIRFMFCFNSLEDFPKQDAQFGYAILAAFFEAFGDDAESLSTEELLAKTDHSQSAFVDLTSPAICADSYLTQALLMRGAFPLLPRFQGMAERPSADRSLFLSRFHGVELLGHPESAILEWKRSRPELQVLERLLSARPLLGSQTVIATVASPALELSASRLYQRPSDANASSALPGRSSAEPS